MALYNLILYTKHFLPLSSLNSTPHLYKCVSMSLSFCRCLRLKNASASTSSGTRCGYMSISCPSNASQMMK